MSIFLAVTKNYFKANYSNNPVNLLNQCEVCKNPQPRYKLNTKHGSAIPTFKYLSYQQCLPGCVFYRTNSACLAALWKTIRHLISKLSLQVMKTRLSTLQMIFHARHMMEETIKHNNSQKLGIDPAHKIQLETRLIKVRNQVSDLYCMETNDPSRQI